MKHLLKSGLYLMSVLSAALLAFTSAQAFEAAVTGQVDQLVLYADNGADKNNSEVFIADNDSSNTRFRFIGLEKYERTSIGFRIELGLSRNPSSSLDIGQDNDGSFTLQDRWLEGYFDTFFGKISLGKGSGAADNTSETDLSGTAVITYASVADTAGGFTWTYKNGDKINNATGTPQTGTTNALTIGDTRNDFDGLGRNVRIRYDTPTWAGAQLAGSVTNGSAYELGLFYNRQFAGDNKVALSVGYVDTQNRQNNDDEDLDYTQLGASISYLAPFGFNITGAYGQRDYQKQREQDRKALGIPTDSTNYYCKVGWKKGIHAASIEYGWQENLADIPTKSDSSNWSVGYVATPWKGVELYGAYRNYSLDLEDEDNPEDLRQVIAGTRIKF